MINPKKNSLINKALAYLMETSKDLLNLGVNIVFNPEKIVGGLIQYKGYRRFPISKKVYDLGRSQYFLVKNNKIYLTKRGRIKIIKNIIKDKRDVKVWDNKWRAIIFDIPEANRRERNFLRKELKWMGFKELQHSVWITPYDIEKELSVLLNLWHKDFKGDIRFLKINKITNDEDIKNFFKI